MSDVRRFFFDDGISRKRWHMRVDGSSQVLQVGKLGGSLKESTKLFKTAVEAAEKSEKLIAARKRDGYVEIDPTRLEIVRLEGNKNATEQQIKAIEKQIGCKLPDEYRHFLKKYNGGRPNPDFVRVPGMKGIDNVGVGSLFHLRPSEPGADELSHETERCQTLLPQGHLPIAGSSDLFTLSLKPGTFGCVYWWFHETDDVDDDGNYLESAGYLLAGSFDEFLTRIAVMFGDDEESIEATKSKGATKKKPRASIKQLLRLVNHEHTPQKVKEIEEVVKELGDLSGISDGEWPFNNISSPQVARCLLEAGLNPEITDTDGHSLLWQCASSAECIDLLAERGVRIDRRSGGDHETALMRAVYLETLPAVKRLLEQGANPTVRMRSRDISYKLERNEKLRQLIEQACESWRENHGKWQSKRNGTKPRSTPAGTKSKQTKRTLDHLLRLMKHDHITDECDEVEEIEEVISEVGDLSGIQDGEWPNIDQFESPRLLSCLLEAGLNPELLDNRGNSLLSQCVVHPDCIDLLVERGVEVDRRSGNDNMTALMRAAYKGDQECVQRLLDAGADPTLEFSKFARIMLNLDDKMNAFIEAARSDWKRNKH